MADESIVDDLRNADPDRYLSVLYAPQPVRDDLIALHAFNAEIASVRDRVSQPLPGEIRLQWWRDLIEGAGEPDGSPLAEALLAAMETHGLPRDALANMLEARIFDLYDDPMPSVADLEGYAGETASALIQLASLVVAPGSASDYAIAAGHAGCAQAIAGLLRSLPIHRARGQCYVPADILASAGITRDRLIEGTDRQGIGRVVSAMVALGRSHFTAFMEASKGMPPALRPAYLPAFLADAHLDGIVRAGAGAANTITGISPLRRQFIMMRRALAGW